jgi:putative methionine-R-sulfoxide reductase with GAF domain
LLPQIQSVIALETDLIANLANITAMLQQAFGFFWVGIGFGSFYRIAFGKGVCATKTNCSFWVPFHEGTLACTFDTTALLLARDLYVARLHSNKKQALLCLQTCRFTSKAERYEQLLPQIQSVIALETDLIANLANITAMLQQTIWLFLGRLLSNCPIR